MTVEFISRGPTVSEQDVTDLEAALRAELPPDYRRFLLTVNGGEPEPNVSRHNDAVGADMFLGIGLEEYDLLDVREVYADRCPSELLAVAYAAGGNLLCLSLETRAVYFWDHEREAEEDEVPTWDNLTLVCESFEELLESLTPVGGPPAQGRVVSASIDPDLLKEFGS